MLVFIPFYTTVSSDEAFWLDKRRPVSVVIEYDSTGASD